MIPIDKNWALFLDRDGVINHRLKDDYVKNWGAFQFEVGSLEAIATFSKIFGFLFVVTNQQGIGKGLMQEADLQVLHRQMLLEIEKAGGRIDRIYHCPHLRSAHCPCRKPRIGMALQAQSDFPALDFSRSVMVGDTPSDIEFGKAAGMYTVFIAPENSAPPPHNDWHFASLSSFSSYLLQTKFTIQKSLPLHHNHSEGDTRF